MFNLGKLFRPRDVFRKGKMTFTETGIRQVAFQPGNRWIKQLRQDWQQYVKNIPPYPGGFEGRGIVISAGGVKYFTCAWMNITTLRNQGCTLPIEVWYTGQELTPEAIEALAPLNVECKNVADYSKENLQGYALKPMAILKSKFKEILFLDADNNCMKDPAFLFESKEYKDKGAIFWPDFWTTDKKNPIWKIIGSDDFGAIEQESGQVLINKERCWKELNLCMYFNRNARYYYQMLLGDKDTFKFAWVALGTPYHMVQTPVGLAGFTSEKTRLFFGAAMVQHDMAGNILFIHRNVLKWSVTQDDEVVLKEIRRFKKDAVRKSITIACFDINDGNAFYTAVLDGDIETCSFEALFGDFEVKSLKTLRTLRNSPAYQSLLLHTYFIHYRPGYPRHIYEKN